MPPDNFRIIYISSADSAYRPLLRATARDVLGRRLAPLLGAGASLEEPSCLPMACHLVNPLIEALWSATRPVVRDAGLRAQDVKFAEENLKNARLERLLDALLQTHGRAALEYMAVLNSSIWNDNHAALAALAHRGFLPWCVTLNFDLLIEEAIKAREAACRTVCPLIFKSFQTGKGKSCTTIVKPHGSFVPPLVSNDPLEYLLATVSQVGNAVAPANFEAMSAVVTECPVLLVGGYSDHDWDIFPMLRRLRKRLEKVIWIAHAKDEVADGLECPLDKAAADDPLRTRIQPFLCEGCFEGTLLVGRLKTFLKDLIAEVVRESGEKFDFPPELAKREQAAPDNSLFLPFGGPTDEQTIRTTLSLAMLMQHTGEFSIALLTWLRRLSIVQEKPEFGWRVEHLLAHTYHTRNEMEIAIPHMKRSVELKRALGMTDADLAGDTVWLGYEHLWMAKRPNPLRPLSLIKLPFRIFIGMRLMRKGVRAAEPHTKVRQRSLASFYRADLLHSWGNLLMLFGRTAVLLHRPYFRFVKWLYDRIARKSDLMAGEYYWMRHLEARLLAGSVGKADCAAIDSQLDEIEGSNSLLQQNVQIGNTYAYRALLAFLVHEDRNTAIAHLRKAEESWSKGGSSIASGRRRVLLFRRFLQETSLLEAAKQLFLRQREPNRLPIE